jgi:O-antigen ligase
LINRLDPVISQRFNIEDVAKSGGSGRTDIWDKDIELYSNSSVPRKIFGQGVGSITTLTGRVAHNTWLETLVELGLLGVILFSGLVISIAKQLYNSKQILLFSIFISYIGLTISLSLLGYKPLWGLIIISIILGSKKTILNNKAVAQ